LADTWVSVALTYQGLKALGVPQDSLDSFAWEFRQGMAAREQRSWETLARAAPKTGSSHLGHRMFTSCWSRFHLTSEKLEAALDRARQAYQEMPGIKAIWRQDCHALPNEKEPFGFRDGISHPAIEGSGIPGTNPREQPLKAGEFVLGYPDEMGGVQKTEPELLGRNGTYVVFPQTASARGRVSPISESELDQS
jgi:deferrochelatase/peroxidase EfeB